MARNVTYSVSPRINPRDKEAAPKFLERLTDMTAGTVEAMEIGQEYRAFPVK